MATHNSQFSPDLLTALQTKQPLLWLNQQQGSPLPDLIPSLEDIAQAQDRMNRSAALLMQLFPELIETQGQIESALLELPSLKKAFLAPADLNHSEDCLNQNVHQQNTLNQKWFLKADHALPIAGSIKARGGFHEVIAIAEKIALENNLISPHEDLIKLASKPAKAIFSHYSIAVGSTGNLGLSIGIMAAALGFSAVVHMSVEAKEWKKQRLRSRGVQVIEHSGDYAVAVEAGRKLALKDPKCHFVDDEQSMLLFLGYAAAAEHLAQQLVAQKQKIDQNHPLFVYIPCGVGGAPGGITYGLKAIFGEHVHCFFAEPVASPCMLVQLASQSDIPLSVYDIGLDNHTEADGLAVGLASNLVSPLMRSQLSGVFTVADNTLYENLYQLKRTENIELEPSAAAGLHGPLLLENSSVGKAYLETHQINIANATHVIWSTGGSLVPATEMQRFQNHGRDLCTNNQTIDS